MGILIVSALNPFCSFRPKLRLQVEQSILQDFFIGNNLLAYSI